MAMNPLLTLPRTSDFSELARRWQSYLHYIQSIRSRLPATLADVADASWRYDMADHRCFHDAIATTTSISWSLDENNDPRADFWIELLGGYDDFKIQLNYIHVTSLETPFPSSRELEWSVDEFGLQGEYLVHRIRWANDQVWTIVFGGFQFEIEPISEDEAHRMLRREAPPS